MTDDLMILKSPLNFRKNSEYEPQRILVGVTGGSAAGKTTLCETIKREIQFDSDVDMTILSCDSFYKEVDKTKIDITQYNFDHPDSIDWDYAFQVISTLLSGKPSKIPNYSFVTYKRENEDGIIIPAQVIVFEGILALYDERIRNCMSYKIFIHCDDDIRLCRRIIRDVNERGRNVTSVLFQYSQFVKRSFENFIQPFMSQADLIIPGHRSNHVSVAFIVNHLKNMAKQNGLLREKLNTQLYFGDILYSVDGFMRNRTQMDFTKYDSNYKQLFFPEEQFKNELLYITQNFLGGQLQTKKAIYKMIKLCFKQTFIMFEKCLAQNKQTFDQVKCYHLNDLLKKDFIPDKDFSTIIVAVPYMFRNGTQKLHLVEEKLKQFQHIQLIVINIFSDIKAVTDINWTFKRLKILINAFLVGKLDKLKSLLLIQQEQEPDIMFQQDRFYKKLLEFVNKKQQKNLTNQDDDYC
ncbi:unnamed protein product (macronuclear) [Paramecium tetraurelia]|uniref:uridine/cytidine kinase n=1 Tax=Paramecium tetraurelia TaxID=5888 RepID=A0D7J2_PARTE|nr:uncharacterized protein GSPATT00002051001 [Paramecium tetraurelia]CAK79009.1 unnamed protein product [Paramecium tetraurelia]|eukprot:XP_001446406.1 hypothetical protein (macronuclear) [Paramecium tetraurelia strain d4-2]